MTEAQARWRCETCKGELTMPAGFSEWGYACCYASMTYLGIEIPAQVGRNAKRQDPQGLGPKDEHAVGGTPMRPDTAGTWSNEERDG